MILPTSYCLDSQTIPAMECEDLYKHLGVLIGPDPEACLGKLATEFREDTEKLFQSSLADWMKLAFKEFVVPKLAYTLRSTLAHKKWGKELDKFIRRTVKRSLGLPGRTCDAFFYVPVAQGGLGLRSVGDELDNMMITHAVKILTSPDPLVRVRSVSVVWSWEVSALRGSNVQYLWGSQSGHELYMYVPLTLTHRC